MAGGAGRDRRAGRGLRRRLRVRAEGGADPAPARRGRRGSAASCSASRRRAIRPRSDGCGKARDRPARRRLPVRRTRLPTPISPRSASCWRSIATTGSRPVPARSPGSSRPTASTPVRIERIAEAVAFGRDLVNAPANVLGPDALEQAAARLAESFGARARWSAARICRGQFPARPRRRPGGGRGAAHRRFRLGPRRRAEGHDRRQGRDLRQRRPRHQARLRHGADEEGHGRRGDRADARPARHGGRPRRAAAGDHADRRERDLGVGDAAGRRRSSAARGSRSRSATPTRRGG